MHVSFPGKFALPKVLGLIDMLRLLMILTCVTLSLQCCNARADDSISIATGDGNGPKQPQAAVAADGTVYVVFGSGEEISLCFSTDNGKSFSAPAVAFRIPNLSLGMRRGPRITAFGDSLIITAVGGKQGKGRDGDVLAWRSTNRGETWSGPVQVNDKNDSAREGLHAMTVSATGEAWCTWLDLRNLRTELYASTSADGGASWSQNQLVYRSPEKSICECCHPSIAIHDKTIQVLFRNSLDGNRDMFLASMVQKSGQINVNSRLMGNLNWKLNACPMDGGMLAVDVSGVVSTVWRRGREIFIATSEGSDEQLIGLGEQPWITSTKDGPIVVWSKIRGGELLLQCVSDERVYSIAANARDAVIVAEPVQGKTAFVFWEKTESGRSSINAKAIEIATLQPKK